MIDLVCDGSRREKELEITKDGPKSERERETQRACRHSTGSRQNDNQMSERLQYEIESLQTLKLVGKIESQSIYKERKTELKEGRKKRNNG